MRTNAYALRRYQHFLEICRGAFRSYTESVGPIIECRCVAGNEELLFLQCPALNILDNQFSLRKSRFMGKQLMPYLYYNILPISLNSSPFYIFVTYFGGCISKFAGVAAPLNRKLVEEQLFRFDRLKDTEIKALETLKQCLLSPPMLALPKLNGYYRLDTNACNKVGLVHLSTGEARKPVKPVGYWPRKLIMAG